MENANSAKLLRAANAQQKTTSATTAHALHLPFTNHTQIDPRKLVPGTLLARHLRESQTMGWNHPRASAKIREDKE